MILCLGEDRKRWEVRQTLHGSYTSEVQEWVELLRSWRRNFWCQETGKWFHEIHMWSWWQMLGWRLERGDGGQEIRFLMMDRIFLSGSVYFERRKSRFGR